MTHNKKKRPSTKQKHQNGQARTKAEKENSSWKNTSVKAVNLAKILGEKIEVNIMKTRISKLLCLTGLIAVAVSIGNISSVEAQELTRDELAYGLTNSVQRCDSLEGYPSDRGRRDADRRRMDEFPDPMDPWWLYQ